MALLVVSGATGGHVRAIDRSAVLHMCEDELGVTTIARMSTELCSFVCKCCDACGGESVHVWPCWWSVVRRAVMSVP